MKTITKLQNFSSKTGRLYTYGYSVQTGEKINHYKVFKSKKEAEKYASA